MEYQFCPKNFSDIILDNNGKNIELESMLI